MAACDIARRPFGRRGDLLAYGSLAILGILSLQAAPVLGQPPMEALHQTSQRLIVVLHDEELKKPDRAVERRQRLVEILGQRLSYWDMTKRALGSHWNRLTDAQQHEFVRLFQQLLAQAYIDKIEGYGGQPIQYLTERLANGHAEVRAKLMVSKHDFLLDFRLVERDGEWRVYDVIVDDISLISSYRGQFSRLLRFTSYDSLLHQLKEKADSFVQVRAD